MSSSRIIDKCVTSTGRERPMQFEYQELWQTNNARQPNLRGVIRSALNGAQQRMTCDHQIQKETYPKEIAKRKNHTVPGPHSNDQREWMPCYSQIQRGGVRSKNQPPYSPVAPPGGAEELQQKAKPSSKHEVQRVSHRDQTKAHQ